MNLSWSALNADSTRVRFCNKTVYSINSTRTQKNKTKPTPCLYQNELNFYITEAYSEPTVRAFTPPGKVTPEAEPQRSCQSARDA